MQKRINSILFFSFLTLILILSNCGLTDSNSSEICMSAKVSGETFSTDSCHTGFLTRFEYQGTLQLRAGTFTEEGEGIVAYIFDIDRGETGTYTTTGRGVTAYNAISYYKDRGFDQNNYFQAPEGEGSITIETFTDEGVTGSFNFNGITENGDQVTVTSGEFNISAPDL